MYESGIKIHHVLPEQDTCGCHVCAARNTSDNPVDMYAIEFDEHVIRLCRGCVRRLRDQLNDTITRRTGKG